MAYRGSERGEGSTVYSVYTVVCTQTQISGRKFAFFRVATAEVAMVEAAMMEAAKG